MSPPLVAASENVLYEYEPAGAVQVRPAAVKVGPDTAVTIAFAVGLQIATLFSFDALDEMVDVFYARAQRQDATIVFAAPLPATVLADLARWPGVRIVEGVRDVPVRLGVADDGEILESLRRERFDFERTSSFQVEQCRWFVGSDRFGALDLFKYNIHRQIVTAALRSHDDFVHQCYCH